MMKFIAIALLALAVFVAVWMFVVVPAEKKHHERKLASIRKRIENRANDAATEWKYSAPEDTDGEKS